ncbi:MAG: hypothetical protein ACLGH0_01245 [Thermoanaerobaculia bacterium]
MSTLETDTSTSTLTIKLGVTGTTIKYNPLDLSVPENFDGYIYWEIEASRMRFKNPPLGFKPPGTKPVIAKPEYIDDKHARVRWTNLDPDPIAHKKIEYNAYVVMDGFFHIHLDPTVQNEPPS